MIMSMIYARCLVVMPLVVEAILRGTECRKRKNILSENAALRRGRAKCDVEAPFRMPSTSRGGRRRAPPAKVPGRRASRIMAKRLESLRSPISFPGAAFAGPDECVCRPMNAADRQVL